MKCHVTIEFAEPQRADEDVRNALDMADFPAEVTVCQPLTRYHQERLDGIKALKRRVRQLENLVDWVEGWVFRQDVEYNSKGHDLDEHDDYKALKELRNRIRRTPK